MVVARNGTTRTRSARRRTRTNPSAGLVEKSKTAGVHEEQVLDALSTVPRARFVAAELVGQADRDVPLSIGFEQVTTPPSLVAVMIQGLAIDPHDTVLEVGTGSGYQAAVLSRLAARVYSIERVPELAVLARANLEAQAISNVIVVTGDGTLGLPAHAPYDKITVTAAFPEVPPMLIDQLRPDGRLVQPIGIGGNEEVVVFEKKEEVLRRRGTLTRAAFVRLIGAHGFPR